MVKLQIGASTFFCDTAEEAVRIHRLVGNGIGAQATASPAQTAQHPRTDGQLASSFMKKLTPHIGKELTSEELAKIVGAKSANGLGPKMHQLRKNLANDNVVLEDFVMKKKLDATSPTSWLIVKAAA